MSGRLRAYDGVLDGIDVLHGVAVERSGSKTQSKSEAAPRRSTLQRILERATDVIGTQEEAMRWLGTPVRALNYATPISLLVDDAGADQVLAVLANLENGVL